MPLLPFHFNLKDAPLRMTVFDCEEFDVEVRAHVIGGDLEYEVIDARLDGSSLSDSDDALIRAIGKRVKEAATAELDDGGKLFSRLKDEMGLSFNDERGWRAA